MRLVDDYVATYLDRNMKYIMDEWSLTTRGEITDFQQRVQALEDEIGPASEFMSKASERLTQLEKRLNKIKEGL